jgi:hypothetical protein
MKHALLVLALLLDATPAGAQDMRPGLASVAVVSAEPDGRYGLDGTVVKPARLRQALVELDAQMAIGHVQLKAGRAAISPAQLAEIRALASEIGARLMVEEDGRMVLDAEPPAGG